jgi:hypothetical protein
MLEAERDEDRETMLEKEKDLADLHEKLSLNEAQQSKLE